jgi:hypothetical protein
MADRGVLLKELVRQRHWKYSTFCNEYDKAARTIEPALAGAYPSRAQFHRWISGELRGLPYPDACRVLENMFPGWSAEELFRAVPSGEGNMPPGSKSEPTFEMTMAASDVQLITSGAALTAALIDVVRNAHESFVAVGSRSREPTYLHEIERALEAKPDLVHYRILIGTPHSQILKDHLVRLLEIRHPQGERNNHKTLHIGFLNDLTRDYERFFVASEQTAVICLPSANSPVNFDTGLRVRDPQYVQGLLQHGMALYGKRRLESFQAIDELEVLE